VSPGGRAARQPWLTGPRIVLTLACGAVAFAAADTYVIVLALPDMMTSVGLGIDQLQRAAPIVSGFLLGYVAMLTLLGRARQGLRLGLLISDTAGRAWRVGQTDHAIGAAGVLVRRSYAGEQDGYGNRLEVTEMALADELAAAGCSALIVEAVPAWQLEYPSDYAAPGQDPFRLHSWHVGNRAVR